MNTQLLSDKYHAQIAGVLSCYDRVIITGTLHPFCYAAGMTSYLHAHHIRIFDYTQFAAPLRDQIRAHAEALAQKHGLQIEFIRKNNFRKEERVQQILKQRGSHSGLVHIFSAMETCTSYKPWHDKTTGQTYLKPDTGKCLHYYFYFIDEDLGLCYLRVPTWCPFRLQFYFNGHAWLAAQLKRKGVDFELRDNAFVAITDFAQANRLAQRLRPKHLHRKLARFATCYCPPIKTLKLTYHWSLMQAEYATDLVFKRQQELRALYTPLLETLIHSVKPENIATFLGRKLHGNYNGEIGNRFEVRILGSRIKHVMGPVAIKMYDKFGLILRIETTVNDVGFFQQYREVRHRNGTCETKWTHMRKSIYSVGPLREQLAAANQRYLEFLSQIETPEIGIAKLEQLTTSKVENQHRYKGFNLLAAEDAACLRLLLRGEFCISGLTNLAVRKLLPGKTSGQVSRLLKRLRVHGLLKRVGRKYKYYLTHLGQQVAVMTLKLRELYVIPALAHAPAH